MTISRANYRLSRFSFADRERKERKESVDGEEWSIRFFSSRRGVERKVDKHSEDSRSNQTLRRRSRRTGGRVFKVKHLERRLKARLALDALDCLIFRLRAVLRVAGKNTRETVATRFSRAILQSQSLEHRDESSSIRCLVQGNPSFERGHVFHSDRSCSILERNNVVI